MYILYSSENGSEVVRKIADGDTVPALIKTECGDLGCWNCGARVRCLSSNSMACTECRARMAIGNGRTVKLSVTSDGALLASAALAGGTPTNIGVLGNGDVVIFPEADAPGFDPSAHAPIGCTAMDLLLETAANRSEMRSRRG